VSREFQFQSFKLLPLLGPERIGFNEKQQWSSGPTDQIAEILIISYQVETNDSSVGKAGMH